MIRKFRKKPVVVEAVRFIGDRESALEVVALANAAEGARWYPDDGVIVLCTLDGARYAYPGDWVIKGAGGEIHVCQSDIFEDAYEEVG
jgi:hypothetical protein